MHSYDAYILAIIPLCCTFWRVTTQQQMASPVLCFSSADYSRCACGLGVRLLFNVDSFIFFCFCTVTFYINRKGLKQKDYNTSLEPFQIEKSKVDLRSSRKLLVLVDERAV